LPLIAFENFNGNTMSSPTPQRQRSVASAQEGEDFLKSIARGAIRLHFSDVDPWLTPLSSRILGPGYWEQGQDWPNADGAPMPLLLQINWSEVAACVTQADREATLLTLPESGITQIYLHPSDRMAGCDFQNPCAQRRWRIVHWDAPHPDKFIKHPQAPGVIHPLFPVTESAAITFSAIKRNGNMTDAIEGLNEGDFQEGVFEEMLSNMQDVSFSQIAGFPFFFQEDPRKSKISGGQDHRLFLQLGSDSPFNWNEEGQAHWFIRPSELQTLDYSKASYTCESA
jgi:uncharacterized protein YwqG